jgi:hypothetical protein
MAWQSKDYWRRLGSAPVAQEDAPHRRLKPETGWSVETYERLQALHSAKEVALAGINPLKPAGRDDCLTGIRL